MLRFGFAVALAAIAASAAPTYAAFQAHFTTTPNVTGNNASLTGPIGLDFDVGGTAVRITRLGAFDSYQQPPGTPSDGFAGNRITVSIFDRTTGLVVGNTALLFGNVDPLTSGYRLQDVVDFVLPAGFKGSVVAIGYNDTESAFDATLPSIHGFGTSTGGGLISFGGGRYGNVSLSGFPGDSTGGTGNRYGAGTFEFEAAGTVTAAPAPPAVLLLGVAVAGGLGLRLRRKKAA